MPELERDIERRLGERLRALGCIYYKFVSPGQRGVPDRIVICPDGALYFVEMKRPRGRLGTLQSVHLSRLSRFGQRTATVWSDDQAEAFARQIERGHCARCAPAEPWRGADEA